MSKTTAREVSEIGRLMDIAGISIVQLSREVGSTRWAADMWHSGRRRPTAPFLLKIHALLSRPKYHGRALKIERLVA